MSGYNNYSYIFSQIRINSYMWCELYCNSDGVEVWDGKRCEAIPPTEEDIKTAKEKLEKLNKKISSINEDSSCYVEYLDIIKNFLDMKNPTREIMNRLIDKIYVTKDKKLEIYYRIKKNKVLV